MQLDIHWVAAERAQEETRRPDRQRLASTLQGNSARQSLRHQHRDIGKDVDGRDRFAELADHRGFVLTGALAVDALQELMLLDQPFDLRQRRGHRIGSHSHKIAGRIRQQPRQLLCAMSAANRIVRVIEVSGGAPHCQFRPPPPDDAGFPTGRAL
jgi:hypothetical protein